MQETKLENFPFFQHIKTNELCKNKKKKKTCEMISYMLYVITLKWNSATWIKIVLIFAQKLLESLFCWNFFFFFKAGEGMRGYIKDGGMQIMWINIIHYHKKTRYLTIMSKKFFLIKLDIGIKS